MAPLGRVSFHRTLSVAGAVSTDYLNTYRQVFGARLAQTLFFESCELQQTASDGDRKKWQPDCYDQHTANPLDSFSTSIYNATNGRKLPFALKTSYPPRTRASAHDGLKIHQSGTKV
jgi:hypothetical protein